MIKLILCISLAISTNLITNTTHLLSLTLTRIPIFTTHRARLNFGMRPGIFSAVYQYASSATQIWGEAQILLSNAYLIKTNKKLVARPNLWSLPCKLHLSLSEPHVPAPSETSCDTNKIPSEESRLLSTCYGQRPRYSKQSLSLTPPQNAVEPVLTNLGSVLAMPTRSKEADARRKEEEAMAAATLQREKEAAARRQKEEIAAAAARPIATPATVTAAKSINKPPIITPPANPTTSVASPPSAANLNSLLLGHVGQEGSGADADTSTITADSDADKEKSISAAKKKPKKSKDKTSSNSSSKRNSSDLVLKQGRFATATALQSTPPVPSKVFVHEQVCYEAGLELKREDKHAAYVKQIGLLFENIQLVDPTAIMHASVESATTKPLGAKSEMSDNMTIFLGYAPVGRNSNVFKPKKNNNKKKG